MAYIIDANDRHPGALTPDDCELPDCPTCGAPIEIVQMPDRATWFGGRGKARCTVCRSFGPLSLVELDDAGQPLPFQPPAPGTKWFGR